LPARQNLGYRPPAGSRYNITKEKDSHDKLKIKDKRSKIHNNL